MTKEHTCPVCGDRCPSISGAYWDAAACIMKATYSPLYNGDTCSKECARLWYMKQPPPCDHRWVSYSGVDAPKGAEECSRCGKKRTAQEREEEWNAVPPDA